jgi:hypothetical protein
LRPGQVNEVLIDLQAALELEGLPASARDTMTKAPFLKGWGTGGIFSQPIR